MIDHRDDGEASRKIIDIATGVLVGLRGCTQQDAFTELVHAVHRTGIGPAALSDALVALASGDSASPNRHAALQEWGPLLSARSAAPTSKDDAPTVGPQTKVFHGGVDASTMC